MVELLKRYSNFRDQVLRVQKLLELPAAPSSSTTSNVRYRVHLTVEDEERLLERYAGGATVYELAVEFRIHRKTISGVLRRHGIELRYHQTVEVDLVRAEKLQRSGMTLTAVAAALGVGRTTLIRARRAARAL